MRLARVEEKDHLIIDGTLKRDVSQVNDLAKYSHKAKIRQITDISIIYAYDLEKNEVVVSEVFPGNNNDVSVYKHFVEDNKIVKGIVITDKGFAPSKIEEQLRDNPQLHIIEPLKRNDSRIRNNDMYNFTDYFNWDCSKVICKKVCMNNGRFLYSFKNMSKSSAEEFSLVNRLCSKKDKTFDGTKYNTKTASSGTIVLYSDVDLEPDKAYQIYAERWPIELVFRQYKLELQLDTTDVRSDFNVHGSEFINHVASTLSLRLFNAARKSGVLDEYTYGDMMEDLSSVWRKTDSPEVARTDDESWVTFIKKTMVLMEQLGLSLPVSETTSKADVKKSSKSSVTT